MERVLESNEAQLALMQALNNTNITGKYFDMRKKRSLVAILTVLAMAATKTAKIELLQATDAAGTGAKAVTGAEKTVTANAEVIEANITLATFLATGTITINGLVFTAHATVTTVASREFSISGNDTADAVELAVCINDATYGVPGITATSASGVVTLVADDGHAITIASAPDDGTSVKATVEAIAAVDISVESLDSDNGFYFVAPKVTTTANATAVSAVMLAADQYHNKVDQVSPHTIL